MSSYAPEPAELDARPLLSTPYTTHHDEDGEPLVVIKTGGWDADFFGCFDSFVNCCTVWWLPCVSLAQISQRIGWAPYWKVLQIVIAVYIVEILLAGVVSFSVHTLHEEFHPDTNLTHFLREHKELVLTGSAFSLVASACTLLGSISGVVLIFITWSLRSRIRELFLIPGSTIEDGFASVCCSVCTIAQMATHVKSYKKGTCDIGPVDTLPGYGDSPRHYRTNAKPVVV